MLPSSWIGVLTQSQANSALRKSKTDSSKLKVPASHTSSTWNTGGSNKPTSPVQPPSIHSFIKAAVWPKNSKSEVESLLVLLSKFNSTSNSFQFCGGAISLPSKVNFKLILIYAF